MADKPKVSAQFIYSGLPDYWPGDGDRWDDNKGCLFASYGRATTLRELVDELVSDYSSGGDTDGKSAFDHVSAEDVRAAILDSLTDQGRADYANDVICEFATAYAEANPDAAEDDRWESPHVIFLIEVELEDEDADRSAAEGSCDQ